MRKVKNRFMIQWTYPEGGTAKIETLKEVDQSFEELVQQLEKWTGILKEALQRAAVKGQ